MGLALPEENYALVEMYSKERGMSKYRLKGVYVLDMNKSEKIILVKNQLNIFSSKIQKIFLKIF